MNVLGVAGQLHDAAVALIVDGCLISAAMEERFCRKKHAGLRQVGGLPSEAISFCLYKADLEPSAITDVAYFMDPMLEFRSQMEIRSLRKSVDPIYFEKVERDFKALLENHTRTLHLLGLKFPNARIHLVDHHLAHAASAFYCSNFESAACLTIDHNGEESATRLAVYDKDCRYKTLLDIPFPHSLGFVYESFTHYLGFEYHDEYKVMGLASYGTPIYRTFFEELVPVYNGSYRVNEDLLSPSRDELHLSPLVFEKLGLPRTKGEQVTQRHADIAASLQYVLEDRAVRLARLLKEYSSEQNLVMAGGVTLNVAMNSAIARSGCFDRIFVQPAASDDGTALGAALHIAAKNGRIDLQFKHAFWGPSFTNNQILEKIELYPYPYRLLTDSQVVSSIAKLLDQGKVLGLVQGAMEWGPRALGNRSILADARREDTKDRVNRSIKFREEFRPFAPAVLEESCMQYFDLPCGPQSPYMLFLANAREEYRAVIPAVVHVDGTARVQTVNAETNPLLYKILAEFRSLTGIPIILNTSFNLAGEPIVCTPFDALSTFARSEIDALFMGNYLVVRDEQIFQVIVPTAQSAV
jgi:carbamoyltransferase